MICKQEVRSSNLLGSTVPVRGATPGSPDVRGSAPHAPHGLASDSEPYGYRPCEVPDSRSGGPGLRTETAGLNYSQGTSYVVQCPCHSLPSHCARSTPGTQHQNTAASLALHEGGHGHTGT
jgi:hypothetical protein